MDNKIETESVAANDVVKLFNEFINGYDLWRKNNNISGSIDNVYEILTAMMDKLGRICRYVKHQERNDPKSDWPEGMTSEMAGLLVYMIILKNYYNIDISEGMKKELEKAIEQHSKMIVPTYLKKMRKKYDKVAKKYRNKK